MKNVFFVLFVSLLFTSCATILTGTRDTISFSTTPSGTTVYKDGVELCRTPCSVPMRRKLGESSVEFKLENYQTRLIILDKSFNGISIINLFSLFGWGIDALTGSIVKYDRKAYDIKLSKDKSVGFDTRNIKPEEIRVDTKNKTVDIYVKK